MREPTRMRKPTRRPFRKPMTMPQRLRNLAIWRKARDYKRATDPLCELCLEQGKTKPADEVHHITPIAERPDLLTEPSNLLSVCIQCHKRLEPTLPPQEGGEGRAGG